LVLALAAKSAGQTGGLRSITAGYPGKPEMDERDPAKRLAKELGVEHHEVEISTEAVVDNFSTLIDASDDLLADIAGQGYFALSQKSSEMGAPVLLMGQGGDELFWGYSWVRETAQRMSEPAHGRTGGWIEMLLGRENSFYANSPEIQRAKRTLPLFSKMPSFGNIFRSAGKEWDRPEDPAGLRITRMISRTYLLANGLPLADRLGMAHSVEARQLLLDHRLWEKVLSHRMAAPDQFLPPKAWLKNVAREILPAWWLDRPKRGFAPPGKEWKRAILQKHGALLSGGAWAESGLLPERWIRRVMTLGQNKARYTDMAYKLLVGECWMRNIRKYCA
jgi:asparagine synthase (glutamine-hydrolysing)